MGMRRALLIFLVLLFLYVNAGASCMAPCLNQTTQEIETLVFEEMNKERERHGLRALTWNILLSDIARRHSLDMAGKNYLSHKNHNNEGPSDRAAKKRLDITKTKKSGMMRGIGENICKIPAGNIEGYGQVKTETDIAGIAMKEWMKSPEHRANILNPDYDFIGIGAAYDGNGNYYITQNFK
jgi:uncharacterized protein YkwD